MGPVIAVSSFEINEPTCFNNDNTKAIILFCVDSFELCHIFVHFHVGPSGVYLGKCFDALSVKYFNFSNVIS